jgi:hypothetical protein
VRTKRNGTGAVAVARKNREKEENEKQSMVVESLKHFAPIVR